MPTIPLLSNRQLLSGLAFVVAWSNAHAAESSPYSLLPADEKEHSGWSFYIDNDRLSLTESDYGYTAGFALARSGRATIDAPLSLHRPLLKLSRLTEWVSEQSTDPRYHYHSISYGMAAFTPENIQTTTPILSDRPYACLAYTASTQQTVIPTDQTAFLNTLSLGLLGTGLCKHMQNLVHDLANGIAANGWNNQISHGIEPTVLWRLGRQRLLHSETSRTRHEVSWNADAQFGWATDAGLGISWRWGLIRSPWWSFTPQQSEYAPIADAPMSHYRNQAAFQKGEELYIWAGGMMRYRLYNSLLQGQFRDSAVEISNSKINPLLAEIWVGFTQRVGEGLEINLSIRARSREFDAADSKSVLWGSVALRQYY